jgi:hypothetical protein
VVRREIETQTGRHLGISAVYTTLERLEQKGSSVLDRRIDGGPRRASPQVLRVVPLGARALKEMHRTFAAMTAGSNAG